MAEAARMFLMEDMLEFDDLRDFCWVSFFDL